MMSGITPPRPAALRAIILWISGIAIATFLVALAAFFAYFALFSTFRPYDDEGYMMMNVKHFLDGSKLYDEVPTLYGPFYFSARLILHGMANVPLSTDSARWITMVYWLATSGVIALVTLRLSRRAMLAVIGFAAAFYYLLAIAEEPAHPQEIVVLLLALTAAIATWADPGRPTKIAAFLGAVAAGLIMIKINVGIFVVVSLLSALMLSVPGRFARASSAALVLAAILLPFAILRHFLTATWGISFAVVVAAAFASSALVASVAPRPFPARPIRIVGAFSLAAIATATLVSLPVLIRGTTPYAMINSLLIMPARLSNAYVSPARFSPFAAGGAAFSAILAVAYWRVSRRSDTSSLLELVAVVGKAILCFLVLLIIWRRYPLNPGSRSPLYLASYITPFLWLLLIPPSSRGSIGLFPRLVLVLVAVLQVLQGYPAAGGQLTMGSLLIIPIAVVCLGDALDGAERRLARGSLAVRLLQSGLVVLALLIVAMIGRRGYKIYRDYEDLVPLVGREVRGADRVRTDEKAAATYQWLIANLSRYADTFESTIGMNSLFLWTGIAPPSKVVIGSTLDIYDDEQQQDIIQGLLRSPRSCVIYHRRLFDKIMLPGGAPGPLLRMVREEYKSCGSVDEYDFCVRKGRELPTLVDCVRLDSPGDEAKVGPVPGKLVGTLLLTAVPGRSVSRLTVYDPDRKIVLADTQPTSKTPLLEIETSGTAVRIGSSDSRELDLAAPPALTLSFMMPALSVRKDFLVLRLIDRAGRVIKSIPFLQPADPQKFF